MKFAGSTIGDVVGKVDVRIGILFMFWGFEIIIGVWSGFDFFWVFSLGILGVDWIGDMIIGDGDFCGLGGSDSISIIIGSSVCWIGWGVGGGNVMEIDSWTDEDIVWWIDSWASGDIIWGVGSRAGEDIDWEAGSGVGGDKTVEIGSGVGGDSLLCLLLVTTFVICGLIFCIDVVRG